MRLIDGDKLLAIGRYSHTNTDIANAPTVNAIPIERIKQLREEIERSKPNNQNFQWYRGEIIQANKDLVLINNMMKEYE